uniref:DNA-directed RNA polymerase II subunit rpb1-like n=1 Tax=Styela clava TaxID=7725 RepID=UPI001939F58E|nr:DNA-directed RNA polymerase II subunit rpb1-like [Styela clava]
MMLVRLLFFFALCALALGNYYQPKKCYVKKVSPKYYSDYRYSQKYTYGHGTNKPHGKYCRSSHFAPANGRYCPNHKHYPGYYYKSCPDQLCYTALFFATSRCHGNVKLSKAFYYRAKECNYYYGKSCQTFGFNRQPHGRYKRGSGSYESDSFPHGSNSASYEPSSVPHGSNSGSYEPSSVPHGSNSGSYKPSSVPHGSNSGSYEPSSVPHGSNSGSYEPSSVPHGSNSGSYEPSSVPHGSNSGSYEPSSVPHGSNSGSYEPSSVPHGSNSGSYEPSSVPHGSNSGSYEPSSVPHGSNSGSYEPSSYPHGSNSGSYGRSSVPHGSSSVPHGSSSGSYGPSSVPHGYPGSKCYCYTRKCTYKFVACYEHEGHHYEDTVKVQVPCGCSCYKGSNHWR